ncbi:ABC transporter ATP-binding protein/permease [Spiroplasma sabaudiense Ar-1343]|uniref:ABC transporter ATP-binding protein/permease n=1 Tax=Spiroplasma sabaudiense Ar-1343 TaxID=1276257 RepID=W6AJP3_9MOLU|nr:ABC transporter ATP-binding protein [Spiroplasma sabaudiense]AHI53949.1 ABC transporter ATP-binding protein/permease [Spiroplasma sabaudiense Ar-1343]
MKKTKTNTTSNAPKNGMFFKMIASYYKKEWKITLKMVFLMILIVSCQIMIPILTNQMNISILYEKGVVTQKDPMYWGVPWQDLIYIGIGVVFLNSISSFLFNYTGYLMGKKIEIDLRNKCLERLVRQDISYYSDKKIGEILTNVVSDTQLFGDWAVNIPMLVGISFFQIIAALSMMFIFQWQLALVACSTFLLILISMIVCFTITTKRYYKVREVLTQINGNVTDRIVTVRLIKSSGTENYETQRFKDVHQDYYKRSRPVGKMQASLLTILFGGVSLLQFATIISAMLLFGNSDDPVAIQKFFGQTFASFALAQGMIIGPLFNVMNAAFGLAMATVAAQRIQKTLTSESIIEPHYFDGVQIDGIKGDIEFKDIRFAYPEKPTKTVLPKFSFTFKEGKSYAFVGATGSGKSTISRLLLRFYDPTEGSVIINEGINLKDVNLASYLAHVGYVEQEPQILFGDVFENIKYGSFGASNEAVIEACKKAELHDLIETWPDGYDTILGERGFLLSGGQKQRLVIARMFLKDPTVLILDEATSALDNIVEKEIQEKLESLMKGRTTVSIAHRLSTIKNADQIVVLGPDGAGIVQTGTFNELKNQPGHFKNLYEAGLME